MCVLTMVIIIIDLCNFFSFKFLDLSKTQKKPKMFKTNIIFSPNKVINSTLFKGYGMTKHCFLAVVALENRFRIPKV